MIKSHSAHHSPLSFLVICHDNLFGLKMLGYGVIKILILLIILILISIHINNINHRVTGAFFDAMEQGVPFDNARVVNHKFTGLVSHSFTRYALSKSMVL